MEQAELAKVAILPVTFTGNLGSKTLNAKLDTGAEMCHVFCMEIFGLTGDEYVEERNFVGLTGSTLKMQIYELDIEIAGQLFQGVRVAAGQSNRTIIGMNLLNKLTVNFDGPADQVSVG